ncbi:dihydroorotate dehydrogenase electron transfer subunit [Thermococcus thioreducens]|uniref:Probable dihydroorotate dehydrogenase B (NAD(+)), electron transfer subunit n=1 Tax=Thermococcus thioreducens TaxID=277988 RepID=A0A0Q2RD70_9EURY|nr:dihydroorotate dehydrogenase electron transfer subunit [Thermococcus thioreducens]ASJ11510.1 dihydroorotate dehydrogenase electron transfer subunit [Thermococcus thioreducens]KQH81878.1 dihydroorotate dehydrogenase [Thermococcus thioreducens]SEW05399.1 dihydroorotate dehydrogenase electron transfer subunit [Thermococcus thioreducens]
MLERVELREVWNVAEDVKAFRFDKKLEFRAGQFIMVWLPGVGEKPFSLAWRDLIVVKRVGPFTSRLFEIEEGDHVWIRGPYGRGFEPRGERIALVGGGIGIPPLYAFARQNRKKLGGITLIYGARSRDELALMDVEDYVDEVIITTDDGSAGRRGFPTEVLAERKGEFDWAYACGPEPMLKTVLRVMNYENVQISAERYMKCGIGVCGSCNLGKYLVCRDGPVFDGFQLRGLL